MPQYFILASPFTHTNNSFIKTQFQKNFNRIKIQSITSEQFKVTGEDTTHSTLLKLILFLKNISRILKLSPNIHPSNIISESSYKEAIVSNLENPMVLSLISPNFALIKFLDRIKSTINERIIIFETLKEIKINLPSGIKETLLIDIERMKKTVFVPNFHTSAPDSLIKKLFSHFGSVKNSKKVLNNKTNTKMFFVEFSTIEEAHSSLSLDGEVFNDIFLECTLSSSPIIEQETDRNDYFTELKDMNFFSEKIEGEFDFLYSLKWAEDNYWELINKK